MRQPLLLLLFCLQAFHKNSEDMMRSSFLSNQTVIGAPGIASDDQQAIVDPPVNGDSTAALDDTCVSTASTMRQVEMNNQLRDLNRVLAMKEQLADRLVVNDDEVVVMKEYYEAS
jgi:hypothetical protein